MVTRYPLAVTTCASETLRCSRRHRWTASTSANSTSHAHGQQRRRLSRPTGIDRSWRVSAHVRIDQIDEHPVRDEDAGHIVEQDPTSRLIQRHALVRIELAVALIGEGVESRIAIADLLGKGRPAGPIDAQPVL